MAEGLKIKANGAWKDVDKPYIKISGVWKEVLQAFLKVGGEWKTVPVAGSGYEIITSSKNWVCPNGVTKVDVLLVGGGYHGSAASLNWNDGAYYTRHYAYKTDSYAIRVPYAPAYLEYQYTYSYYGYSLREPYSPTQYVNVYQYGSRYAYYYNHDAYITNYRSYNYYYYASHAYTTFGSASGGAGGAGGKYRIVESIKVAPGQTYSITIGGSGGGNSSAFGYSSSYNNGASGGAGAETVYSAQNIQGADGGAGVNWPLKTPSRSYTYASGNASGGAGGHVVNSGSLSSSGGTNAGSAYADTSSGSSGNGSVGGGGAGGSAIIPANKLVSPGAGGNGIVIIRWGYN